MTKKQRLINLVSLVLLILVFWNFFKSKPEPYRVEKNSIPLTAFEEALDCKCDKDYVVTPPLKIVKNLPEDKFGIRHQKWLVQSPSGQVLLFVHNLELCPPLTLQKNDLIHLAGEFKWTDKGGLIHWTHYDPQKKRQTGYIEYGGIRMCDQPPKHN